MGAGSITSNVKSDKTLVVVKSADEKIGNRTQEIRCHVRRFCRGRL